MKRLAVLAVLALTALGTLPAHSLVDIDEYNHVYASFVTADSCVIVHAWESAYPYADAGSFSSDAAMWVDLYVQDETCSGDTSFYYGYSQQGDQVTVSMDPTGSVALVTGQIASETDVLDLRLSFRADELPVLDPYVDLGPPANLFTAFGRSGTATATIEGTGLSLADVDSQDASSYSSHWVMLG